MWPGSRLFTAERDGYFAICPSTRPNPGEDEVDAREQPLQTAAQNSSRDNKNSSVNSTDDTDGIAGRGGWKMSDGARL